MDAGGHSLDHTGIVPIDGGEYVATVRCIECGVQWASSSVDVVCIVCGSIKTMAVEIWGSQGLCQVSSGDGQG